jgi:hypothetical protein
MKLLLELPPPPLRDAARWAAARNGGALDAGAPASEPEKSRHVFIPPVYSPAAPLFLIQILHRVTVDLSVSSERQSALGTGQ